MSEVQAFRPENELEEALVTSLQDGSPEAFLEAFAESDVYLPTASGESDSGRRVAREGDELPLPVLEQGGERFIPVFTSPKQLARYAPGGTGFLRLKGRALASVWPEDCRLALNPRGDVGLILDPEQVKAAEDAPARGEAPGFFVGEPKEEPVELLEAMRKLAARRPEIRAAYRALVVRRPGAKPEHVIGLELDPHSDRDLVIDTAVEAVRPLGLTHVAFVPLVTGVDAGTVGRFMLERTTPFWERETRS